MDTCVTVPIATSVLSDSESDEEGDIESDTDLEREVDAAMLEIFGQQDDSDTECIGME